ncbi:MAG: CBS domain-containing protein, partial [Chloroflexi bacterium]|nr:CBS domain-containing protein [Chloroflexota bacterium]
DISIGVLVDDFMIPFGRQSVPVVDSGLIAGIISLEDVQRVRRDLWEDTPVSSVMTTTPLFAVGPNDSMTAVVEMITQHFVNQVLVLDTGVFVGVVTRADVTRFLQVRETLSRRR